MLGSTGSVTASCGCSSCFTRVLGMIPDPPAVVFVTAYEDKALDAFDIGATDYLMKPVSRDRLANTMRRLVNARRDAAGPPAGGDEAPGDDEVGTGAKRRRLEDEMERRRGCVKEWQERRRAQQ